MIDFIVECSFKGCMNTFKSLLSIITSSIKLKNLVEHPLIILIWELYIDGSSNVNGTGAGVVFVSLED